jgi:glycine/D-amino acid oxidase-like deaminating enzyme
MKVAIVGGGIIGASIAFQLSRSGAQVTVIDAGQPAASATSFGWVNASFYADHAHHELRVASMKAYQQLIRDVPDLPVNTCGALWWESQGEGLREMQASLGDRGYSVEYLTRAQSHVLEPDIKGLPAEVLRFPSESAAEAGALADDLLALSGARIIRGMVVQGIAATHDFVRGVETSVGLIEAGHVVIAAGTGAPDVLASVGVKLPMVTRPGVLVTTKPIKANIRSVLVTPHGEVRQLPDGRLLASAVANHQGDDASSVTEPPDEIAVRVLGWLNPMIDGDPLEWDAVAVGYRPMPEDGLPVIGEVGPKGLHVAVMHSGVTLAAITGEAVSAEIMEQGGYDGLLAPYRPQRFQ